MTGYALGVARSQRKVTRVTAKGCDAAYCLKQGGGL